jgi:hypothetical protein
MFENEDKTLGAVVNWTLEFQPGNDIPYGQDHRFLRGVPSGIKFRAEKILWNGLVCLVAEGYGGKHYGNGAVYVNKKYLGIENEAIKT